MATWPVKATAGAVGGLGAGALWGRGIVASALPAIGPVIAGGALAASAIGTSTAGGLIGALIGLGIPDEEAEHVAWVKPLRRRLTTARSVVRRWWVGVAKPPRPTYASRTIRSRYGGYGKKYGQFSINTIISFDPCSCSTKWCSCSKSRNPIARLRTPSMAEYEHENSEIAQRFPLVNGGVQRSVSESG